MDTQHPGMTLLQELTTRGRSQKDFAKLLGKRVSEVNELIKGKRNITIQRDMLLGSLFDTPPKKRLLAQMEHDYSLAKQSVDMSKLAEIKVRKQLFAQEQTSTSVEEQEQEQDSSLGSEENISPSEDTTNPIASAKQSPTISATQEDLQEPSSTNPTKQIRREDHEIFRNF